MDHQVSNKAPDKITADCLVIMLGPDNPALSDRLPEETRKHIREVMKSGDFAGKKQQSLLLRNPPGIAAKRLLLMGTGTDTPLTISQFSQIMKAIGTALRKLPLKSVTLFLDDTRVRDKTLEWIVRESCRMLGDGMYSFDSYRSEKPDVSPIRKLTLLAADADKTCRKAAAEGAAVANGMALARDLGNLPPNACHPEHLAQVAKDLASGCEGLTCKVITEKQAEKLGMGAFCAVARGSDREGRIIVLEWKGASTPPIALVGKGVTFDTGGISLKPGAGMDEMKFDMCGAASVLGAVRSVCELKLPIHLVAVIAAAENMPDGRASRPGDIVKTLSGKTVEILNTDAEGRLVLCDALTWVQEKYQPEVCIDVATLTGACVIALGSHAQAVYANDAELAKDLLEAGDDTGDRGWPMPLWDDYQEQLDSPFADMANIGGAKAGSVTAACFLSRFTQATRWAHLDIAGTAWNSGGKEKGATGRPVPMLMRFLINRSR